MKPVVLALLGCLLALPVQALEVTDDSGRLVQLARPAERIIALSPHATELVFAAGAGERLVGVVAYSDYPPAAKELPKIGDAARLDRERLLSLGPDLVIGWASGNREADLSWLEKQGLAVYRSEPRRLEQIAQNIEHIGLLTATQQIARQEATRFRQQTKELSQRYRSSAPVSVFYQLWSRPLMTINGEHIISEVIRLCGGKNIFAALPSLAAQVSREAVIVANPQAIIAGVNPGEADPLASWQDWPTLTAVKQGQLYRIEADLLHRATPRILEGAQKVCEALATVAQDTKRLSRP